MNREEILKSLDSYFKKYGHLNYDDLKYSDELPSIHSVNKEFGTLNKAKEILNIKCTVSKYDKNELLQIMKNAFESNPNLTTVDFGSKNNLPSASVYVDNFGSFNKAKELADIKIKKYNKNELLNYLDEICKINPNITVIEFEKINESPPLLEYIYQFGSFNNAKKTLGYPTETYNKKYTDEELIEILKNYNNNIGFPKSRDFMRKNNLPCARAYMDRFGSFKKALEIAGIDIPKNKTKIFNRTQEYTLDEIKEECQMLIDLYLQDHIKLPPIEYFNNSEFLSESMIYRTFGGYKQMYNELGYNDVKSFNDSLMEKDMLEKYKEIWTKLERIPNSRDIDKFAYNNRYYYGCSTYLHHFGGMKGLYKEIGDLSNIALARYITKDEIVQNLYKLKNELGFIPTQIEINNCEYLPSINYILHTLNYNGMAELQINLFGEKIERANKHITEKGTKCLSTYEYIVAQVIENENYNFIKDEIYRNHMSSDKNYSCDFVIYHNNKPYFIEVFGMMGHKPYEEKTKLKIQLCKDNDIPLLELYPKDISTPQMDEIRNKIKEFISNN